MLRDADIRDGLCDFLEARFGKIRFFEELTMGKSRADIVMVKPAMSYLDMIREVRDAVNVPVAAYSVSGEYAMVKAAAANGWIDEASIICEMAVGAFRAGAQIYETYFAEELAGFIKEGRIG